MARGVAFYLIAAMLLVTAASTALFAHTASLRLHRDVGRAVLEDDTDLLEGVKWGIGATADALRLAEQSAEPRRRPALHRREHGRTRALVQEGRRGPVPHPGGDGQREDAGQEGGGDNVWKFETPRGRLSVISKEENPVWAPPDWHYVEQARKRKAGLVRLERGQSICDRPTGP